MADILLSKRGDTTPLPKISKNWVSKFLRRNKDLKNSVYGAITIAVQNAKI
jgi:hypothetical protein